VNYANKDSYLDCYSDNSLVDRIDSKTMQTLIESKAGRRRHNEIVRTKQIARDAMKEKPCSHCGACCSSYAILLTQVDIDAEPKLKELARPLAEIRSTLAVAAYEDEIYFIAGTDKKPARCPLLTEDNRCSIYKTRPRACRRYPSCQFWCKAAALEKAGLNIMSALQVAKAQKIPLEKVIVAILNFDIEKVAEKIKEAADAQSKKE
jgi:Fe-S-cluster containining protein